MPSTTTGSDRKIAACGIRGIITRAESAQLVAIMAIPALLAIHYLIVPTVLAQGMPAASGPRIPFGDNSAFAELSPLLAKAKPPIKAAQSSLNFWNSYHPLLWRSQKTVKTKEGDQAKLIILDASSGSMPGDDFCLVFLLIGDRIVDWTSCYTLSRRALQKTMLEDVDGDGHLDLAFRNEPGWFGSIDKRRQLRPGDKREWLYAYAITNGGFVSLFPMKDQELDVVVVNAKTVLPVKLEVIGLPAKIRENFVVECKVQITNESDRAIALNSTGWFNLRAASVSCLIQHGESLKQKKLQPGESASETIRLLLGNTDSRRVELHLSFQTDDRKWP